MSATLDQLCGLINNTGLKKTPLKLLNEVFSILRGLKQQNLLSATQQEQITTSLKQCASSPTIAKLPPAAKKNLKKVLSFYNLKVQLAQREPKNASVKKEAAAAAAVTENGGDEGTQKKKKKKKKKSKEAQKEKKEKKIEAGAAQEESALPSFKKLLVDTTQVYMNEDKKKKNNKKRKVSVSDHPEKIEHKKSKKGNK